MIEKDLDTRFRETVKIAYEMTQTSLPQDVQLRLYAYYKQATIGTLDLKQASNYHLRDAFKTNAWIQVSNITADEAKEKYIEIINSILKKQH